MKLNLIKVVMSLFLSLVIILSFSSCTKPLEKRTTIEQRKDIKQDLIRELGDPSFDQGLFYLLGYSNIKLEDFESVTFYIGTKNNIKELDNIFRDYAKSIGKRHVALFLEYGTKDYSRRFDEMQCLYLTSSEIPSVVYVEIKEKKCYVFSHSNGLLLTNALLQLNKAIKEKSKIYPIKVKFDLEAMVEGIITAFPTLKPLRDLILRISQHVFLAKKI